VCERDDVRARRQPASRRHIADKPEYLTAAVRGRRRRRRAAGRRRRRRRRRRREEEEEGGGRRAGGGAEAWRGRAAARVGATRARADARYSQV